MLLSSVLDCVKSETCWLCGEELKRKERRIFIVDQVITAFIEAHSNPTDSRNVLFTDCVTNAPNVYDWWSAFNSCGGNPDKFKDSLDKTDALVHLTIGLVCQRSSSVCSNLYCGLTKSIGFVDPLVEKLQAEDKYLHSPNENINNQAPHSATNNINSSSRQYSETYGTSSQQLARFCSAETWSTMIHTKGVLEGWMTKLSHDFFRFMRKWQRRYFVLDFNSRTLCYYLDEAKQFLRGRYQLAEQVRIVQLADGRLPRDRPHQIEIIGAKSGSGQQSSLLVAVESIQLVNFWFAGLRLTIRVSPAAHSSFFEIFC